MKKLEEAINKKLNKGIHWLNHPSRCATPIPDHALEWLAKELAVLVQSPSLNQTEQQVKSTKLRKTRL